MRENKFFDDSSEVRVSELLERLGQFDENPAQFLANLLAAQCFLGEADAGAILCSNTEGRIDVLAIYPLFQRGADVPQWLVESVELVREIRNAEPPVVKPLEQSSDQEQPTRNYVVMIPLKMAEIDNAIVAFKIETEDRSILEEKSQQLQLIVGMLNYTEARSTRSVGQERLTRLQQAMEILSTVNQQEKFISAAMTFCNEADQGDEPYRRLQSKNESRPVHRIGNGGMSRSGY
jgi:hypothetical protein